MKLLDTGKTFNIEVPSDLWPEDNEKILESLILMKKEKDRIIKVRYWTNGSKKNKYTERGDLIIPMVSTEAVMISVEREAKEKRDVVAIYTPNEFIQNKQPDIKKVMSLRVRMAEIMWMIAPGSINHTSNSKVETNSCMSKH